MKKAILLLLSIFRLCKADSDIKSYKSVDKAFMDPMVDYYQEYLALKKR